MALFPLQPGLYPLGQMDVVDTEITSLLGGEVLTLTSVSRSNTSTEKAAYDALDGYLYDTTAPIQNRPAATRAATAAQFPLYLCDDGTSGYGTLFGQVIGTSVGLVTVGTNIGPHTAQASGKATLWSKSGRYAVSVNALATDFVSTIPLAGLPPGTALGFCNSTDIGKLAHNACSLKVAATGVAHLVEFSTRPGLVNTPNRLVGATEAFDRIEFEFHGGNTNVRTL